MVSLRWKSVLDAVSFAWVCTAAPYRHRLTANPAKLAGTRKTVYFPGHTHTTSATSRRDELQLTRKCWGSGASIISLLTHRWLQFALLWMPACTNYPSVCLKCWFCSRWMKATCTNSTFDSQRFKKKNRLLHTFYIFCSHFGHQDKHMQTYFDLALQSHHRRISGVEQAEDCYPEWERSAHTAVGHVIITTCTVSTLSHSGWQRNNDAGQNSLTILKVFFFFFFNLQKFYRTLWLAQNLYRLNVFSSHQGCGQAEDGQERTGRSEGCVFTDSGLFSHLNISCSDVIGQWFWYHRLLLFAQSNVAPAGKARLC